MADTSICAVIVGYGEMGHALETLLRAGTQLHVWDITPADTGLPKDIAGALRRAQVAALCVPAPPLPSILPALIPMLHPQTDLLSVAKGLDDRGRTAADILADADPRRPSRWGVLGGPMIAEEIRAGRPAFADLGTPDAGLLVRMRALFHGSALQLLPAPDARAVSWCGVLKNVYAPLVGISDELGWGDNARGHLVMSALAEMRRIVMKVTGANEAVYGEAGIADFVTTVTSAGSHHHALGRQVARGKHDGLSGEGIHSLAIMADDVRFPAGDFPLFGIARGLVCAPARVVANLRAWLQTAG